MHSLDKITLLTAEEFCKTNSDDLVSLWRKNHQNLLGYIKSTEIPYFGLHGTSQTFASQIETQKYAYANLATFYDKQKTEERLYQLYQMCAYVSFYARPERTRDKKPGMILIFDLEREAKKRMDPWQRLASATLGQTYCDNPEEEKFFTKISKDNDFPLWRADETFVNGEHQYKYNFSKHYLGKIPIPEIILCKIDPTKDIGEKITLASLRERFCAQEILTKAFKLVAEGKHGTI